MAKKTGARKAAAGAPAEGRAARADTDVTSGPALAAGGEGNRAAEGAGGSSVEQRMVGFAEDLGGLLGTAEKKASEWLSQRQAVADQLTKIRDTANELLSRLTGAGAEVAAAVQRGRRRGRPPGSRNTASATASVRAPRGAGRPKGARKRKGGMSAAGRARIAAAQKARWAKIKAEKG